MIADLLRRAADARGDSVFLRFGDRSDTFGDVDARSNAAANLLREIGVRRGDKVCVAVSNRPEFLELWFGLAKLGAVMVPADPALREDEFAYVASHSDARVLVAEESAARLLEGPAGSLPGIRTKVWVGGLRAPAGFLAYGQAVVAFPRTMPRPAEPDPSAVMSIVYTPGTTGLPKGALLSHLNYRVTAEAWLERVVRAGADDVYYTALPLSRVRTQTATVLGSLISGRPMVLARAFDPAGFPGDLRRSGATVFEYGDSMIESALRVPPRPDDRRHRVRLAFGPPPGPCAGREFEERFGIAVVEGYHLTECAGFCLATSGGGAKDGSIGKPFPCFDARVVDDFDEPMPAGLSGEIVVRPGVAGALFPGYYRERDRTAEHMRNGWFHTGDRGYADADGDFFFLDRVVDSIRRGGEVYSSLEIERAVNAHPAVLESAATGVVSELEDEDVRVFVVPRPGAAFSAEELVRWCAARLGPAVVPRYVEVVSALPKTADGAIRKGELRRRPVPSGQPA